MTAVAPTSPPVSPGFPRSPSLTSHEDNQAPLNTQTYTGPARRDSLGSIRRKSVPNTHERNQSASGLNDIDEMSQNDQYPTTEQDQQTTRHYQQQLPHFSGQFSSRVTSLQSNDSVELQSTILQSSTTDQILSPERFREPDFDPPLKSPSFKPQHITQDMALPQPQTAVISSGESNRSSKSSSLFHAEGATESPASLASSGEIQPPKPAKLYPQLHYRHNAALDSPSSSSQSLGEPNPPYSRNSSSPASNSPGGHRRIASNGANHLAPAAAYRKSPRPTSTYSLDNRNRSPNASSPNLRAVSGQSYDSRRSSYMDLTQPAHIESTYNRPVSDNLDNSYLQAQVGAYASLLPKGQTLEKYREAAKKTNDPGLQYDFAVFLVGVAQKLPTESPPPSPKRRGSAPASSDPYTPVGSSRKELLREAKAILERTAGKLPQAQYYLADAFSSGLFNNGIQEPEKAFPLFISASKRGHSEAAYRAALCYEFGWGCRRDVNKAVQFYRASASKGHPGAMGRMGKACLSGDLGLTDSYREGVKWLKRATELADAQYPSAPYELGLLHEHGFGEQVLEDKEYTAQLFTKAAELGWAEAGYRMGEAYELGLLGCPRDPALSVHFYHTAAQKGHPTAMMALCAWYLCGAEGVMERNEEEAAWWAVRAAEFGMFPYVEMRSIESPLSGEQADLPD